jgi:hypothetical protein
MSLDGIHCSLIERHVNFSARSIRRSARASIFSLHGAYSCRIDFQIVVNVTRVVVDVRPAAINFILPGRELSYIRQLVAMGWYSSKKFDNPAR